MSHLLLFYYITVVMIGLAVLIVSILGTIRSRIGYYGFLVLFFGAFTVDIMVRFIRQYILMNVTPYPFSGVVATYVVQLVFGGIYIISITLFFHRCFSVRFVRLRDFLAAGAGVYFILSSILPVGVVLDETTLTIARQLPLFIGTSVYCGVMAYFLAVALIGKKRDRPVRELVLIWSFIGFGLVGFVETFLGLLHQYAYPVIELSRMEERFFISTIPYLFTGGILIYYFGSYLLAEGQQGLVPVTAFTEEYNISPREYEVIGLLNKGLNNREIAEKLFISLSTVKTHVHNIYDKTGAKSRYELYHLIKSWSAA